MPRHGLDGFWFCYSLGPVPLLDTRAGFSESTSASMHRSTTKEIILLHCSIAQPTTRAERRGDRHRSFRPPSPRADTTGTAPPNSAECDQPHPRPGKPAHGCPPSVRAHEGIHGIHEFTKACSRRMDALGVRADLPFCSRGRHGVCTASNTRSALSVIENSRRPSLLCSATPATRPVPPTIGRMLRSEATRDWGPFRCKESQRSS